MPGSSVREELERLRSEVDALYELVKLLVSNIRSVEERFGAVAELDELVRTAERLRREVGRLRRGVAEVRASLEKARRATVPLRIVTWNIPDARTIKNAWREGKLREVLSKTEVEELAKAVSGAKSAFYRRILTLPTIYIGDSTVLATPETAKAIVETWNELFSHLEPKLRALRETGAYKTRIGIWVFETRLQLEDLIRMAEEELRYAKTRLTELEKAVKEEPTRWTTYMYEKMKERVQKLKKWLDTLYKAEELARKVSQEATELAWRIETLEKRAEEEEKRRSEKLRLVPA